MSPDKQAPQAEESENPAKDRPGDRGIVYHGDDWDRAQEEEENDRGMVSADEEEPTEDFDEDEEAEDVEGHREPDVPDDDVK